MASLNSNTEKGPLVVAHRGASGYLPENSIEAFSLGFGMGAPAVEFDVVLSRDEVPVIVHDFFLDHVSDVAAVFPGRAREDGRYYVMDFCHEELVQLNLSTRHQHHNSGGLPRRYPGGGRFRIPTLRQALEYFRGLEASLGRTLTLFVELKAPAFHRRAGKDLTQRVVDELAAHGYAGREDSCWIVCIDSTALKELRFKRNCELKLLQIIGSSAWEDVPDNMEDLQSPGGIRDIATYAQAVGPWCPLCYHGKPGQWKVADFIGEARKCGLGVSPFTFAADHYPDREFPSFAEYVRFFAETVRVDGFFADHPDAVAKVLR